jgi:hypothetical protein
VPSTSLLDCLGHDRRVKAEPHAVASRALTQRPRPEGRQLSRRTGEDQGTAISPGRTAVRRAISGPLNPVTKGLSRSLADSLNRRSGRVTGLDGTDSQADSAGSIPVTRSSLKAQVSGLFVRPGLTSRGSSDTVWVNPSTGTSCRQISKAPLMRGTAAPRAPAPRGSGRPRCFKPCRPGSHGTKNLLLLRTRMDRAR